MIKFKLFFLLFSTACGPNGRTITTNGRMVMVFVIFAEIERDKEKKKKKKKKKNGSLFWVEWKQRKNRGIKRF